MSGMQRRPKWREGSLQPTHTCWASTPNLSESISSPPLVQSNRITLVSNQRISLLHSSPLPPPFTPLPTFVFLLCSTLFLDSAESAGFKKGNWLGQNVMGPPSAVRRAAQRIHLPKCAVKCIMYIEPPQYQLTLPANIMWSIPKMALIDRAGELTCLLQHALPLAPSLFIGRNYEVWTSLGSLQPDGISIFQPPNEIKT